VSALRFFYRVAIANGRLLSLDGQVRFRWRDSRHHNRIKIMRLDAVEFLRRFLLHVLPARFVKIRHFGLLANRNCRRALTLCRRYLNSAEEQPTGLLTTQQIAAVPTVTAALCVSSLMSRQPGSPPVRWLTR